MVGHYFMINRVKLIKETQGSIMPHVPNSLSRLVVERFFTSSAPLRLYTAAGSVTNFVKHSVTTEDSSSLLRDKMFVGAM